MNQVHIVIKGRKRTFASFKDALNSSRLRVWWQTFDAEIEKPTIEALRAIFFLP